MSVFKRKLGLQKYLGFGEPLWKRCCIGEIDSTATESKNTHLDAIKNSTSTSKVIKMKKEKRRKIKTSRYIEVMSFLSNNGRTKYFERSGGELVNLDIVRGKPLIIFSFNLPSRTTEDSIPIWRIVAEAYPELSKSGFEIVVSVTVKRNKKVHFDNFISNLPCLFVPYTDLATRNSVCSFLNANYKCSVTCAIVVDHSGRILPFRQITSKILKYGFEWITRKIDDIYVDDEVLKIRLDPFYRRIWETSLPDSFDPVVLDKPLSLHKDFLLCDPSRVLTRFDNQSSLTVSDLRNKHVALYLCFNGRFMKPVSKVYKKCLANNQELEVVLVFLPYYYEEPKEYYDEVTKLLKSYDLNSWIIFPFDHKVCFRLKRVFCTNWDMEKLIILPPNCKSSGDMEGRAVLQKTGINAPYPFTRSAVLEQRFKFLKSLTPASFFTGSSKKRTCLVRNGKRSNVRNSAIEGKKLILYLDWVSLSEDDGRLCQFLMELYPEFKALGCEIVFVPMDSEVGLPHHVDLAKMPWPMMPVEAAIKAKVCDQLILRGECAENKLIVFGEDGEILSRFIKNTDTLTVHGVTNRIFRDSVRQEIYNYLEVLEELDLDYNIRRFG